MSTRSESRLSSFARASTQAQRAPPYAMTPVSTDQEIYPSATPVSVANSLSGTSLALSRLQQPDGQSQDSLRSAQTASVPVSEYHAPRFASVVPSEGGDKSRVPYASYSRASATPAGDDPYGAVAPVPVASPPTSFRPASTSGYSQSEYSASATHNTYAPSVASGMTDTRREYVPDDGGFQFVRDDGTGEPAPASEATTKTQKELPEYYHNMIVSHVQEKAKETDVEVDGTKQLEFNPVSNTVAERSSLLTVFFPFLVINTLVLLYLYINVFWRGTTPGFPVEILILLPVTLKIFGCIFTPIKPSEHVLVDGQNVAVFVSVYNESLAVLTKTLGSINAQSYKSIALVIVVDHHADGLRNVLDLLEADVSDGICNPVTGDLEYNGIFANQLPYTVIMKRHHSGKHGSECVFLRHLYKHCENFKYFVMVDGDTALHPDAISNLVTHMEFNPDTIASFGKVLVANDTQGLWAMTQAILAAFEFTIDKHFQSVPAVNHVACIPGPFACFRTDRIFSSQYDYWGLSLDSKTDKSYLWKPENPFGRNLLLQEDRRRTSLLLRNRAAFERVAYVKASVAETVVATDLAGFVAKYRRRFLSTVANDINVLFAYKVMQNAYMGMLSELHSLVALLAQPVLCIFAYAAIVVGFKDSTYPGLLMDLWMLFLGMTVLFLHGHFKYVLYFPVLFVTAPVLMVYVPVHGVLSFASGAWGARGENPGVNRGVRFHVVATYVLTIVAVIVYAFVFTCREMGSKCSY